MYSERVVHLERYLDESRWIEARWVYWISRDRLQLLKNLQSLATSRASWFDYLLRCSLSRQQRPSLELECEPEEPTHDLFDSRLASRFLGEWRLSVLQPSFLVPKKRRTCASEPEMEEKGSFWTTTSERTAPSWKDRERRSSREARAKSRPAGAD